MAMDNQTIYNYSLGAVALLLWYILFNFFGFVLNLGYVQSIIAPSETMSTLVPFILGLGGAAGFFYGVRSHEATNRFGIEVVAELGKVVWPGRKEVTGTTTGVLIFIFVVAMILFTFDKLFGYSIKFIVN